MIQPIDGKHAYLLVFNATKQKGYQTEIFHEMVFISADSDDEACGLGMRVAQKVFPKEDGYHTHFVMAKKISGIENVGRYRIE